MTSLVAKIDLREHPEVFTELMDVTECGDRSLELIVSVDGWEKHGDWLVVRVRLRAGPMYMALYEGPEENGKLIKVLPYRRYVDIQSLLYKYGFESAGVVPFWN